MLLAASPTKATVSPARSPLCSRTVSRSASSWQGWNSSVSAFTTGTPAWSAIVSRLVCAKVRHTTVETWRPSTRATSSTDSRTPMPASLPSTSIGLPPSSAMAALKDTWVRSVGLSKTIATDCGPA